MILQATVSLVEPVTASVQITRPVLVRVEAGEQVNVEVSEHGPLPQRGRDEAGTVWIEFS